MVKGGGILAVFASLPLGAAAQIENAARVALPIVVPFERATAPFIVVRVPVADGSCEPLIFDTGTNTTVLAPALAERAGLSDGVVTRIESLNGSVRAIKGAVQGIGFDVTADEQRVAVVADVAALNGFAGSVAGVYGHDWLEGRDYRLDYDARRIVIGKPGTLAPSHGGYRLPVSWAAGRPVVVVGVSALAGASFSARLVLDSGADHVTLFGITANRIALGANSDQTLLIDSGFGRRESATAPVTLDVGGRKQSVIAELRGDVTDHEEDGLLPTSLFRSVQINTAERVVVFDSKTTLGRAASCAANGFRRH